MRIKEKITKIINKETALYAIVGLGTALMNVVMFKTLLLTNMDYRVANIITIIITKITAFICNKNIVFKSHCTKMSELLSEIGRFIIYRGLSGFIDYFGVVGLVSIGMKEFASKVIVSVVVIILNYITGKKAVFLKAYGGKEYGSYQCI